MIQSTTTTRTENRMENFFFLLFMLHFIHSITPTFQKRNENHTNKYTKHKFLKQTLLSSRIDSIELSSIKLDTIRYRIVCTDNGPTNVISDNII